MQNQQDKRTSEIAEVHSLKFPFLQYREKSSLVWTVRLKRFCDLLKFE